MRTVREECANTVCTLGERVDKQLGDTARVDLEVQVTRDRVLPELSARQHTLGRY